MHMPHTHVHMHAYAACARSPRLHRSVCHAVTAATPMGARVLGAALIRSALETRRATPGTTVTLRTASVAVAVAAAAAAFTRTAAAA
eukprot:CAMPEP_0118818094 /NCGR_PEP_ID=MMETSP1162-20130426/5882_1 /TAXON_ID=33656 /ORGANISM="Phaeocystis Sp, Strain CCMP2710" /LENGTH=86 /DNA_ID=CAMNT_0006748247 /DNA_START=77 /DNA_END=334 /DNA_ORIENTATION=+